MPAAEDHKCEFCGHGKSVEDTCGKLHHQQLPNKKVLAAHHKCMQYSSGLKQYDFSHFGGFKIDKVKKEIARGKKLACSWCKKQKAKSKKGRKTGATAGCELKACQKTFHFYCAKLHAVTSRRKSRNNLDVYRAEHKDQYLKSEEGKQEFSCDETDEENNESEEEAEDEKADDSQHSEDRNSVEKEDKNQDDEDAADAADAGNDGDDETTDRNTDDELSDLYTLVSESSSDLDSLPDCITSLSDQGRASETLKGKHKSSKAKQENDDEIARKKEKQNWKNRKMVSQENVNTVSSDNTLPISDPAKRSKVNPGVSHVVSSSDEGSESPVHCTPSQSCSKRTVEKKSLERTYSQKKEKSAMAVTAEEQEHTDSNVITRPLSSLTKKKLCPKLTPDQAKLTFSSDDEDLESPPLSTLPRSYKKSQTKCLQKKKKSAINVMAEEQEHTDSSDSTRPLSSLTKKKLCPKLTPDQAKLTFSSDDEDLESPPLSTLPRSCKKSQTKCLQKKKKSAINVMAEEQEHTDSSDSTRPLSSLTKKKLCPKLTPDQAKLTFSSDDEDFEIPVSIAASGSHSKPVDKKSTLGNSSQKKEKKRTTSLERRTTSLERQRVIDDFYSAEMPKETNARTSSNDGKKDLGQSRSREENTPKSAKAKKRKLDNIGDGFHRDEKRNTSDSKKKKGEKKTQADTSNEEDEQENGHTLSTDWQILPENGNEECPTAREQDRDGSLEIDDNFEECVLVIPEDARSFEPKMSDVQKKLAQEFEVTEKHVHLWTVVTPVLLPTDCMLYYFSDITDALQRKNWLQLEHLLLDATTIQRRHDEEYIKKVSYSRNLPNPQRKNTEVAKLVKLIIVCLGNAREKYAHLLGKFTDCSGIIYLSLFINNITDPDGNLWSALHQPLARYCWDPAAVSFAEFDRISSKQWKGYHLQELMVLQHWFIMNFSQLKKIIVLPEEEILKCDTGSTGDGDGISHLKSRLEERENSSSHESNLPVVVFIHKINPHIVNFEHYLEAYLKKYAEDFSRQRVICVFHVENLSVKECPEIDLGRSDRHITFFSAFNPAEKPVTLLIADVRDS